MRWVIFIRKESVLLVNLTREQIEKSPSIDEHKPVSRQHEEEYHRYYGYPYYAETWPLWGLAELSRSRSSATSDCRKNAWSRFTSSQHSGCKRLQG